MSKVKVNPEVELEIGGEKKTLLFNHNALFAIEETEGPNLMPAAAAEIETEKKLSLRNLIVLLWAGLLETHPELDVRKEDDLRLARRQVARWLTDDKVHSAAAIAVVQGLVNSTVIARDEDGTPLGAKKPVQGTGNQETGSQT